MVWSFPVPFGLLWLFDLVDRARRIPPVALVIVALTLAGVGLVMCAPPPPPTVAASERPEIHKYVDRDTGVLCYVVDSHGSGVWCTPTRPVSEPAGATP